VLGGLAYFLGTFRASAETGLFAACLLLAIIVAYLILEGWPGWPPVSSKQKLLFILTAAAVVFGFWPIALRKMGALGIALLFAVTLIAPLWLTGAHIAARKPVEFAVAAAALVVALISIMLARDHATLPRPIKVAQIAAAAWALVGLALVAAFGAFVGMAQVNGAAAAVLGSVVLLAIGASLFASKSAQAIPPGAAFAVNWLFAAFAGFTSLYTPHASGIAILLSSLCLAVPALLGLSRLKAVSRPGIASHLVAAVAVGIPALAAVAWAATAFIIQQPAQ
jgi:hypothetical protein